MIIKGIVSAALPYLVGAAVVTATGFTIWAWGQGRYSAGYAEADGKCQAAVLQSQLDAMAADLNAARSAEINARVRVGQIEADTRDELKGITAYVEELKSRPSAACVLTDTDLRGMRAPPSAGSAGP